MNEMEALVQTDQRLFLGSTGGDYLAALPCAKTIACGCQEFCLLWGPAKA